MGRRKRRRKDDGWGRGWMRWLLAHFFTWEEMGQGGRVEVFFATYIGIILGEKMQIYVFPRNFYYLAPDIPAEFFPF
jgi:hypothetical protein